MRFTIFRRILDFASPRACRMCGGRLSFSEEYVCMGCLASLPLTRYHLDPYENRLARIFWGRIPIERAASLFFYQPNTKSGSIIHDIKYNNQPRMAYFLGRVMAKAIISSGFFDGIDIIIPIPLSKKRQRQRGYNQSERIALGVSAITDIEVRTDIVKRIKDNVSQTSLSTIERRENVSGIFALEKQEDLKGKHILLIDDVMTTGATLTACAEMILEAGDVRFSILTLGVTHT